MISKKTEETKRRNENKTYRVPVYGREEVQRGEQAERKGRMEVEVMMTMEEDRMMKENPVTHCPG